MSRPASIQVLDGGVRRVVQLGDEPILVGRLPECVIRTEDGTVTRRHARIHLEDDRYRIRDLGSDNGTFLNGTRIKGSHVLTTGDQILCGRLKLEYLDLAAEPIDGR